MTSLLGCRSSRGSGHRCRESGVSDRYIRALRPGQGFNDGVEFMRERIDYAGAEPGFRLSKDAIRLANSIVSDREFSICAVDIVRDIDPAFHIFAGKCMLQSIHHQFGRDQADTLSLAGTQTTCRAYHF
jgi:hypothetical protein